MSENSGALVNDGGRSVSDEKGEKKNPSKLLPCTSRFGFALGKSGLKKPSSVVKVTITPPKHDVEEPQLPLEPEQQETTKEIHSNQRTTRSITRGARGTNVLAPQVRLRSTSKSSTSSTANLRRPTTTRSTSVARGRKLPSLSNRPETNQEAEKCQDQPEEDVDTVDDDVPSTIKGLLTKLYGKTLNEKISRLLENQRCKAGKFNYQARSAEYLEHIKNLKAVLREVLLNTSKFQELGEHIENGYVAENEKTISKLQYSKIKIKDLEKSLEEMKSKETALSTEISKFSEAKDRMYQDQMAMMVGQRDELVKQKEQVEQISLLQEDLRKSETHLKESQLELEKRITLIRDLERKNLDLTKRLETEMIDGREKLQKEFDERLKHELDLQKQLIEAHDSQETTLVELRSSNQSLENEILSLQKKIEDLNMKESKLREDLCSKEEGLLKHEKEISTLHEKYRAKEMETTSALNNLNAFQDFAKQVNEKLENEKTSMQSRIQQLEEQKLHMEKETSCTSMKMESMQQLIDNLKEAKAGAEKLVEESRTEFKLMAEELQAKDKALGAREEVCRCLENQQRDLRNELVSLSALNAAVRMESQTKERDWKLKEAKFDEQMKEKDQCTEKVQQEFKSILHTRDEHIVSLESELRTLRESQAKSKSKELEELCEKNQQVDLLQMKLRENRCTSLNTIEDLKKEVTTLREKIAEGEMQRRKLHNLIQELRGNVRVFVRTRPFLPSDEDDSHVSAIGCGEDGQSLQLVHKDSGVDSYHFSFDKVFAPTAGQDAVFEEVSEFVQSALDGYNVCLFSYGQTGSGKTHSMQGTGNDQMRGIIPRSIEKVMAQSEILKEHGWTYEMRVSFLEIYNEEIRDLLATRGGTFSSHAASVAASSTPKLALKTNSDGKSYVAGLDLQLVQSMDEIEVLMEKAASQRSVGATDMNAQSSRSHSVFTLHLKGVNEKKGTMLEGQLNLVDLAGSERLSRSGATGDRMKETQAINKSLSSLTDVFTAIANKASHVPFRNSKLTHLLQRCLSGDGKTLMMVNLSPTLKSYQESLCSLRFAKQVNMCELGKPKRQVKSNKGSEEVAAARASLSSSTGSIGLKRRVHNP